MIAQIKPLMPVVTLTQEQKTSNDSGITRGSTLFSDALRSAIENVQNTDAEHAELQYMMATGQLDNPAALSIAATKNEVAVDLLVQLRDRGLNAYSELMRISF